MTVASRATTLNGASTCSADADASVGQITAGTRRRGGQVALRQRVPRNDRRLRPVGFARGVRRFPTEFALMAVRQARVARREPVAARPRNESGRIDGARSRSSSSTRVSENGGPLLGSWRARHSARLIRRAIFSLAVGCCTAAVLREGVAVSVGRVTMQRNPVRAFSKARDAQQDVPAIAAGCRRVQSVNTATAAFGRNFPNPFNDVA